MMMMSVLYKTNTLVGALRSRSYNPTPDSSTVRYLDSSLSPTVRLSDGSLIRWRKHDKCDCEFTKHFVFTWIFTIVATILISRDIRGIFEHFSVRGHIKGRQIPCHDQKSSVSEYAWNIYQWTCSDQLPVNQS